MKEMVEALKRLKNDYGVFEIKAEFEAEGSRMTELVWLRDIAAEAGLPIILKIGGAEAVSDFYDALNLGAKGIIAPMIETPFALSKYLNIIKHSRVVGVEYAFNLETFTACENLLDMLKLPDIKLISGITIGRVDLSGSMGIARHKINEAHSLFCSCELAMSDIKRAGIKTGMGGAICKEALVPIERLVEQNLLDKFETRKVVFPAEAYKYGEKAIIDANKFELMWLEHKRKYYLDIANEDYERIMMLKERVE